MSLRFSTNLAHLLLGAAVLVACFAFPGHVLAWIALGAGCAAIVVSLTGFAMTLRTAPQRALDILIALAATWLIVASRVLGAAPVKWNAFGVAALFVGCAAVGLILHERDRSAAPRRLLTDRETRPSRFVEERRRAREAGAERHPITGARVHAR